MLDFNKIVPGFDDELELVNAHISEFMHIGLEAGAVDNVLNIARNSRGKMVRPILLLLSGRFGADYEAARERLCKLGALAEIMHIASLIHDDIVDDSPFRRGRLTIQAEFGKDVAVYAGDFLLCRVMFHLFQEEMGEAGKLLARTIEVMCKGEIGQMLCRWDTETTIETYLENIYGKTAALFMTVCRLGAMEGGCGAGDVKKLRDIGEHLGYLFQMRDDLLDFFSDELKEGKPLHKDFADGIYTMPVLYALKNSGHSGRLREIAAKNAACDNYDELMIEMRRIIYYSGGIEYTWTRIENHALQAERILASLPQSNFSIAISELICWLRNNCGYPDIAVLSI